MRIALVDDNPQDAQVLQGYLDRFSREVGLEWSYAYYSDGQAFLDGDTCQFDPEIRKFSVEESGQELVRPFLRARLRPFAQERAHLADCKIRHKIKDGFHFSLFIQKTGSIPADLKNGNTGYSVICQLKFPSVRSNAPAV